MSKIRPRQWLERLDQLYNPAQFDAQGLVLLLDGHVDDLFFCDMAHPQVRLYELLLERFRSVVDAFIWYSVAGDEEEPGGKLQYEFNRFPSTVASPATPLPSPTPTRLGLLNNLAAGLAQDRDQWLREHEGRTSRTCSPQEAIRDVHKLLTARSGQRAVIVFQDVNWLLGEQDQDVLQRLIAWPELCQTRYHLVVFALKRPDLPWIETCFPTRTKGVVRLSVDGPTSEEVKAFLIQRTLETNRDFFDWQSLDEIAGRLAAIWGADPAGGLRTLARVEIPKLEQHCQQTGTKLDEKWLKTLPKIGQEAEEVHLGDVVLKPAERAQFEFLLRALQDPAWLREKAQALRVSEDELLSTRILLYGPPGTGKTTIGKMIATESKLPFFSAAAADFQSTYRGGPVEKVKQHFAEWRAKAPCVVFWDEVESVAARRERSQHPDDPITQILAELESTAGRDKKIIIICATNEPEMLDPAFRARFSGGEFLIGYPDQEGRERLIQMYFKVHLLEEGFNVPELARLFEDRAPREIRRCAESCVRELAMRDESVITRQMVTRWLVNNPVDPQTIQYWKQEENKRQKRLQELGIIQVG